MKMWVTLLLLLTIPCLGRAGASSSSCEQILAEFEHQTIDFLSYFKSLLDEKIISQEKFQDFIKHLDSGEMVNPIPHQTSSFGPLFVNSKMRQYYFQFDFFIQQFNKNKQSFDLQFLKNNLENEYKNFGQVVEEKIIVQEKTDLALLTEFVGKSSRVSSLFNTQNLPILAKEAPQILFEMAQELKISTEIEHKIKAELILLELDPHHSYSELLPLITSDPKKHSIFIQAYRPNHPEAEKSANWALTHLFSLEEKQEFIRLLSASKNASLISTIKQLAHQRELAEVSLEWLNKSNPPQYLFFLEELFSFYVGEESKHEAYLVLRSHYEMTQDFSFLKNKVALYSELLDEILQDYEYSIKKNIPAETMLYFIGQGLNNDHPKTIKAAANMLAQYRFNSPENPSLLKEVDHIFSKENKIKISRQDQLLLLFGLEKDWAYQRIIYAIKHGDADLRSNAYRALAGRKSKRSRDLILKLSKSYLEGLGMALLGRPESDLLFFMQQNYKETKMIFDYALSFISYYYQNTSPEVIEIAKKFAFNEHRLYRKDSIEYLAKLPKDEHLDFWKKLASDPLHSPIHFALDSFEEMEFAIKFLFGVKDPEMKEILEKAMRSKNEEVANAAVTSYLYFYFSALEKIRSKNPDEVQQAHQELKNLDMPFVYQLLGKE